VTATVLVNPSSGSAVSMAGELVDLGVAVQHCEPDRIVGEVRRLCDKETAVVGVVGGDGTLRSVSGALAGSSTALLPIPGGTRNHFARANGIDSVERVMAALRGGVPTHVDVAWANEQPFLNNASIGWYAQMLHTKEQMERKLPRRIARALAFVTNLPRAHRFTVEVGSESMHAWLGFVGNGEYGTGPFDLGSRSDLADGLLDVRFADADPAWARTRITARILSSRLDQSPLMSRQLVDQLTVMVGRSSRVSAALDGELLRLANPLRFRVDPGSLLVMRPPASDVPLV